MKLNITNLFLLLISYTSFGQSTTVKWGPEIELKGHLNNLYQGNPVEYIGSSDKYFFLRVVKDFDEDQFSIQRIDRINLDVSKEIPCGKSSLFFIDGKISEIIKTENQKKLSFSYTCYDQDLNIIDLKKDFLTVPIEKKKPNHSYTFSTSYMSSDKYYMLGFRNTIYLVDSTFSVVKNFNNVYSDVTKPSWVMFSSNYRAIKLAPKVRNRQFFLHKEKVRMFTLSNDSAPLNDIQLALPADQVVVNISTKLIDHDSTVIVLGLYGPKYNRSTGFFINKFDLATGKLIEEKKIPYSSNMLEDAKKGLTNFNISSFSIEDNGQLAIHLSVDQEDLISFPGGGSTVVYRSGPMIYVRISTSGVIESDILIDYLGSSPAFHYVQPLVSSFDNHFYYIFNDKKKNFDDFKTLKDSEKKGVIGMYWLNRIKPDTLYRRYALMPDDNELMKIMPTRGVMLDAKHIFVIAAAGPKRFRYGYITLD